MFFEVTRHLSAITQQTVNMNKSRCSNSHGSHNTNGHTVCDVFVSANVKSTVKERSHHAIVVSVISGACQAAAMIGRFRPR